MELLVYLNFYLFLSSDKTFPNYDIKEAPSNYFDPESEMIFFIRMLQNTCSFPKTTTTK